MQTIANGGANINKAKTQFQDCQCLLSIPVYGHGPTDLNCVSLKYGRSLRHFRQLAHFKQAVKCNVYIHLVIDYQSLAHVRWNRGKGYRAGWTKQQIYSDICYVDVQNDYAVMAA